MVRLKTLLDLLVYLVALLGFLALFAHLDAPARLVFPVALVIGAVWDRREAFPLKPAFTAVLTLAVFVFYASQIDRNTLIEPAVNLLVLLLAVRLLSPKGGREYLQIFVLSLFALAASSLLSLSIVYLAYLGPMLTAVTVGLVLLSFFSADPATVFGRGELRRVFAAALVLPASSLVLMLAFFLILPRTQQPLWHLIQPAAAASGLSERVEPGSIAGSAAERRPVFRVQTPPLSPGDLYWRGIVLNQPEGRAWVRHPAPAESTRLQGGTEVRQVFFPEPRPDLYLPALDPPLELSGVRHRREPDLVFTSPRSDRRLSYEAISPTGARLEVTGGVDREFYLQLPREISPRVTEALVALVRPGQRDQEKIDALEGFFLARELTYTLEAEISRLDPVEDFLFVSRQGYCEHFAASFALMLRMAGVPARLVGGYHGGHYNGVGGYYLVTEESAHLWVEALVEGREWVRLDPTRLARNAGAAPGSRGLGWRGLFDAADYYWNRLVITYDLQQQMELFRQAGERTRALRWSTPDLPGAPFLAAAALLAAALLWRLRRSAATREERLLRRYLRVVRRRHALVDLSPALGLQELAEKVDDPACRRFAALYGRAVYRDRLLSDEEYRECREVMGQVGRSKEQGARSKEQGARSKEQGQDLEP